MSPRWPSPAPCGKSALSLSKSLSTLGNSFCGGTRLIRTLWGRKKKKVLEKTVEANFPGCSPPFVLACEIDRWCFVFCHPFYLEKMWRLPYRRLSFCCRAALTEWVRLSVFCSAAVFVYSVQLSMAWSLRGILVFFSMDFFPLTLYMNDSQGFFFGRSEGTCAFCCSEFLPSSWVRQVLMSCLGCWNIDEPKHQRTSRNNWFVHGCRVILKLALCPLSPKIRSSNTSLHKWQIVVMFFLKKTVKTNWP